MFNLKPYILDKLSFSTGIAKNSIEKDTLVSKIDSLKIQELLIMQYSERILDNLEKELIQAYAQHREYESTLVTHSKEHHRVMDLIQNINKDLQKIQAERMIIKAKTNIDLNKIKQDLNISNYSLKKPK